VQPLVQEPGIAAADKDGVGPVDGIHRIVEVMDADGVHPQTLGELPGAGIPVAADHRVGDEQDALDLVASEQGLHPVAGPAEQAGVFCGFTVVEQKQFHDVSSKQGAGPGRSW
jgi:hypothetical protein